MISSLPYEILKVLHIDKMIIVSRYCYQICAACLLNLSSKTLIHPLDFNQKWLGV